MGRIPSGMAAAIAGGLGGSWISCTIPELSYIVTGDKVYAMAEKRAQTGRAITDFDAQFQ